MSNPKPNTRKRKYRADGTPQWSKGLIEGPGVWVTCVKGKERQTVGELYDLFESLTAGTFAVSSETENREDDSVNDGLSIEEQISRELDVIKRPRREQKFTNCQMNTPCVVFISCKPPVDPVKLVLTCVEDVERTGVLRTRYTQRLTPISDTCTTNLPEIQQLCRRIFAPFFERDPEKTYTYKIELRMRNHTTLSRQTLIQEIARCVPEGHKVDLENPKMFILVEVYKSVCGISIVEDYYQHQKFNVMEIANVRNSELPDAEGRIRHRATAVATGT